jgi:peptidoglycan/xylan/chitin deacetylase (PgdA/CDA1 family)
VLRTVRTLLLPAEAESLLDEVLAPEAASLPPPDALYATWSQIGAAAEAGHQIGGHTASHRMRHVLDQRGYREELRRSQRALVEHLGRRSSAMSHPFNSYFVGEEGLCAEEGFEQLATVDGGRVLKGTPAHRLPRRTVFGIHDSRLRFRELLAEGSPWS